MSEKLGIIAGASESFHRDFAKVLETPVDVLENLCSLANTSRGIVIEDIKRLLEIWEEANKPADDLQSTLSVLKHLFDLGVENDASAEDIIKELGEYSRRFEVQGSFTERANVIRDFITPKPDFIHREKIKPYTTTVSPTLYSMSSVVDIRAVYDGRESEDLLGFIPMALVRLVTINDNDEKVEIPFHFQVTEQGLDSLIGNLKTTLAQLKAAKNSVADGANLLELDNEGDQDGS
uniref:COMM domain-containing protein n=1 Tax=Candidatus Kentrum sp. FM TaxID=2126340 RepID=A0A450SZ78_9GAMM|nr:MAG: hypothetical protein BECKFM1743A_GA0114220_102343 [Candidatus Kentron sp. FM]VFJ67160.1 MAG: hypothetical protein BECKFM1743C_GA0114222_104464 [Candidatus Kentron sp. FM]VFK17238.1 MAG: hypothetical protein BECKFM1743B_GA0114221_104684 [Candidatus Kentron sp. FM]